MMRCFLFVKNDVVLELLQIVLKDKTVPVTHP